jgi:hypothetical protein
MPIENYSHMMMENKHTIDGDGVGHDGDEEALETSVIFFSEFISDNSCVK